MKYPRTYVAGFFDGEGSIGIYPDGRGRHHLRTQLAQNVTIESQELFEALCIEYGGNLSRDHNRRGTCFNWQLNSRPAADFLALHLPYLRLKKAQARLALMWQWARPEATRSPTTGHFLSVRDPIDAEVSALLKKLKAGGDCRLEISAMERRIHQWATACPKNEGPTNGRSHR